MTHQLRALVSRKKVRFQEDDFDLDLTYISPRVIAMAAPTEGLSAALRNPFADVERFFVQRHAGVAKIYDLRGEAGASYSPTRFGGSTAAFRFFDHNPAPLALLAAAVDDMVAWLAAAPEHVVAVHCKAGKGRTGMVVSALLLRLGAAPTAADALKLFGEARTHDGKGVTIPSQIRYVHYYEALLRAPAPPRQRTLRLLHVRMHTVPNFDLTTGCDPFFDVRQGDGKLQVFNWLTAHGGRVKNYKPRTTSVVDFPLWPKHDVRITGDTKMVFYDKDDYSEPDKMFHFWFHTAFVERCYLRLPCVGGCCPLSPRAFLASHRLASHCRKHIPTPHTHTRTHIHTPAQKAGS
jgi:phosphatidylinositol-3,4,5-trisphosphate 3-phosphatase/dual-specificity protein phosphatase PTEN